MQAIHFAITHDIFGAQFVIISSFKESVQSRRPSPWGTFFLVSDVHVWDEELSKIWPKTIRSMHQKRRARILCSHWHAEDSPSWNPFLNMLAKLKWSTKSILRGFRGPWWYLLCFSQTFDWVAAISAERTTNISTSHSPRTHDCKIGASCRLPTVVQILDCEKSISQLCFDIVWVLSKTRQAELILICQDEGAYRCHFVFSWIILKGCCILFLAIEHPGDFAEPVGKPLVSSSISTNTMNYGFPRYAKTFVDLIVLTMEYHSTPSKNTNIRQQESLQSSPVCAQSTNQASRAFPNTRCTRRDEWGTAWPRSPSISLISRQLLLIARHYVSKDGAH